MLYGASYAFAFCINALLGLSAIAEFLINIYVYNNKTTHSLVDMTLSIKHHKQTSELKQVRRKQFSVQYGSFEVTTKE